MRPLPCTGRRLSQRPSTISSPISPQCLAELLHDTPTQGNRGPNRHPGSGRNYVVLAV
jgi:hypothetical protein